MLHMESHNTWYNPARAPDMPTNLAIDDRLILEAQKLGRHRTKKETVTVALDEYIQRLKQQQIVPLFGTIDYDPNYDYKRARRMKRN
jgi:putative antitoxin of VapBC-like toxin-antitoxin system